MKECVAFGSVSAGYLSGLCRVQLSTIFFAVATAWRPKVLQSMYGCEGMPAEPNVCDAAQNQLRLGSDFANIGDGNVQ